MLSKSFLYCVRASGRLVSVAAAAVPARQASANTNTPVSKTAR